MTPKLFITCEYAIAYLDAGTEIRILSNLPSVNFQSPVSTLRFLRVMSTFFRKIQHYTDNTIFEDVTGDGYMMSQYQAYLNLNLNQRYAI